MEVNILALQKGEEFFAYVFPDDATEQAVSQLKRDARDPSLNFNWYDAAVLCKRIREIESRSALPESR